MSTFGAYVTSEAERLGRVWAMSYGTAATMTDTVLRSRRDVVARLTVERFWPGPTVVVARGQRFTRQGSGPWIDAAGEPVPAEAIALLAEVTSETRKKKHGARIFSL
jgi:hypothetical protein